MKKKLLSLLFVGLLIFSLTACGSSKNNTDNKEGNVSEKASSTVENIEEADNEEAPENKSSEAIETSSETDSASTENLDSNAGQTIDEQVLFDDEKVELTASNLQIDQSTGNVLIDLTLVNNRDENIMLTANTIYVNGMDTNGAAYASADKSETGGGNVAVYGDALKENGIDSIETIEFEMSAINNDTYEDLFSTKKLIITFNGSVHNSTESESSAAETTYKFFGFYKDQTYIEYSSSDLSSHYVTLTDDGKGYLYLGDDNQGDITEWTGDGDDFVLKAGVSVFDGNSYCKDGILRLDIDDFTLVFLADGTTGEDIGAISAEEYKAR